TPFFTSLASSDASQLVKRTQPWLTVLPIFDGSGVPMDVVGRLRQRDPHRGAWRDGQDLIVVALLEIDVAVVGVPRIGDDSDDLVRSRRRRGVGRTDGGRVCHDELSGSIIGAQLLRLLVGNQVVDRPAASR